MDSTGVSVWDTAAGGLVDLGPRRHLSLYVCGVTPYDTTHMGHAFTYVVFDLLVTLLEAEGYSVEYTQNVTDVDDPLFAKARELGIPAPALAQREVDRFLGDLRALEVRMPDHFPRASEEVPGMIALISRLLSQGSAYVGGEGHVYFATHTFPDYGRLSHRSHLSMVRKLREEGSLPDPSRREPLDFLLWRPSLPDEPAWDAPFGRGRPGWHIECSAMAGRTLGETIDIHGGGRDLIFSHHESEIAQSESANGRPFAKAWMHTGLVRYQGHKMSKSLGNLVLVGEALQRVTPQALRWLLLDRSWRRDWTFTWEHLDGAAALAARVLHASNRGEEGQGGDGADAARWEARIRSPLIRGLDAAPALRALAYLASEVERRSRAARPVRAHAEVLRRWGRVFKVLPAD